MTLPLRVALCQHAGHDDPEICWKRFEAQAREAARKGATVLLTQELFMGPYFCQGQDPKEFQRAEQIPDGPTTVRLQKLAKELGCVVVGSLFEKRAVGLYHNTAVVIDTDGSLVGAYRKMHIPQDPGFDEKYFFTPGDLGFRAFDTAAGRIGVLICWDQWFPEAARLLALQGADLLIYPTAIGWDAGEPKEIYGRQRDSWQTVMRGHAIANRLFVLAVNRVGSEQDLTFWGHSFACAPDGFMLHETAPDFLGGTVIRLDLGEIESQRRVWPHFRDRRTDLYSNILHMWETP